MNENLLPIESISGTPKKCGEEYGEAFRTKLFGFCAQEVLPDKKRLNYAAKCEPYIKQYASKSYQFLQGASRSSGLSLHHLVLLSLHEEVIRLAITNPHCSAVACSGEFSKTKSALIGQNWDWASQLFPWPGLLRSKEKGSPSVLSYHYPGLWNCCGINSKGLSVMWTGAGYAPMIQPKVGVPTTL